MLLGAAHSLFGSGSLFLGVLDQELVRFTVTPAGEVSATTIRSGFTHQQPVAYLHLNGAVYYTDGVLTGMYRNDEDWFWGVERPTGDPTVAALSSGALPEGRYQVALTFVDSRGEESGARACVPVDVPAGGGIRLTAIPTPVDQRVTHFNVYMTAANGTVPYLYQAYPISAATVDIGASATLGRVLETQFMFPVPPAQHLAAYNGRIYLAVGPYLYWTETFRYGQVRANSFVMFPADITLLAAGSDGLYVASDTTRFLQGAQPQDFEAREVLPYGAVANTLVDLPDREGQVFGWMSHRGWIVADGAGGAKNVTEQALAFGPHARGAALFREANGVKQVVSVMRDGAESKLVAQDFFDAEIVRRS